MSSDYKFNLTSDEILIIAKNIKRIRLEKEITQAKLAHLLGVSRSYVCQLEYGIKMSNATVSKLAVALNCEIADLFKK